MSQEILSCYKYIKTKPSYKFYSLLCSASFSILWMMAFSSSAIAKVNSSSTNHGVARAPLINQLESSLHSPDDNIQDLDNSSIKQMANSGVSPGIILLSDRTNELKNKSRNQSYLPVLAVQHASQFGLKLTREVKNYQSCNIARSCKQTKQIHQISIPTLNQQLKAQILPQKQSVNTGNNTEKVKQLVTPGIANSGLNPQPCIAPLTPLPSTKAEPGQQLEINSRLTFNPLLNSLKSESPGSITPTLSSNPPLFNSPTTQPTVTTKFLPVLNQTANSQTAAVLTPLTQRTLVVPTAEPLIFPMCTSPSVVTQAVEQKQVQQEATAVKRKPLTKPSLILQGVYVRQGDDDSARARVTGIYPVTPQALFGGTVDLTNEGSSFDDSRGEGLNINELYFATYLKGLPNLRFVVGQMDLTSYFDRNSFAKDGASHFFNPVFQTNPALSSAGIRSRPGFLANWNVTDNLIAKAAVFSSSDVFDNFSLDGFASEIGFRYGNAIIRGTYSTARDEGDGDSFLESFGIDRGNDQFGTLEGDQEDAYGLNAEVFIPNLKLGLFGRYGRYENRDLGEGADTYSLGLSFLDLFAPDDRLGLAYGRDLSNDALREGEQPDVLEIFYDFKFLPNLRLGFSFQGRDSFEESVLGVRVKSEFDITPKRRDAR